MVRQIFKDRVIAAAGPLPGQLTVDNLKRWTSMRKGAFSDNLDETVTHLLCTEEQFRKRAPRVKEALGRDRSFHIVHYDWFEFSAVEERRLPEKEYSMRNILSQEKAAQREKARVEKGKRDGERFVNTNYFHIYHDREFFAYEIDITRDDEECGEVGQRYTLCLWESNAKPHLYWFTAKFLKRKGSSQPSYYRPSPCAGKWRPEMDLFLKFFRIKTGIDWEDRVIKQRTTALSLFQYTPPTRGKPVGRRLRHSYDYCLEINAKLRGLSWPFPNEPKTTSDSGVEMTKAGIPTSEDNQEEESLSTNEKKTREDTKDKTWPGMYTAREQVDQVDHHVAVNEGELLDYPAHNDRAASTAHLAEFNAVF